MSGGERGPSAFLISHSLYTSPSPVIFLRRPLLIGYFIDEEECREERREDWADGGSEKTLEWSTPLEDGKGEGDEREEGGRGGGGKKEEEEGKRTRRRDSFLPSYFSR